MAILIAGRIAGQVAQYLIRDLLSADVYDLLLLAEKEAHIATLKTVFPQLSDAFYSTVQSLEGNRMPPAVHGADVIFYIGQSYHQLEAAKGIAMIDAAKQSGVKHFVFCSILHSHLSRMSDRKAKLQIEEYLVESGLDYTILQPAIPMQNVDLLKVVSTNQLPLAYSHFTLQGFIDLHDLATVSRKILLNPKIHNRARYELVGQNCTHEEVAQEIANAADQDDIECIRLSRDVLAGSNYEIEAMKSVLAFYERRGLTGNCNVLKWLLGREPTSWKVMIRRELLLGGN